jgi:hypothetical protein
LNQEDLANMSLVHNTALREIVPKAAAVEATETTGDKTTGDKTTGDKTTA